MKKWILFVVVLISFWGCSKKTEMKIAANTWIGYAPIFYADANGWLQAEHIKLIHTVSLNESLQLYNENLVNAMASTQYEASLANKTVYPVILLDKSNGADMVMSNYPLNKLKKFKKIDVYLEIDSVNSLLLDAFLKECRIPKSRLNIKNMDQAEIAVLKYDKPTIVVTYAPYDDMLKKSGFKILASTRTSRKLIVLDAVFSDETNINKHYDQFVKLKKFIHYALTDMKKNPKHFYNLIKPYMGYDYKYKDFLEDIHNVMFFDKVDDVQYYILKKLKLSSQRLVK